MTSANPDALAEALVDQIARILDLDAHHLGRPDYYGPELILAFASARVRVARKTAGAIIAGPLAPLLAAKEAAEARAAQLQAEVEAKDRAILLLLPFVDYAAGEGLMFVETEDGEHPEMDAADIMAAVAEALGLELGSDAYLSLLPKGYFAIRTALAARAATAREGA